MSDINVSAIKAKITANITTNGIQDITGDEVAEILNDLADSSVNKITNAALLGLSEYDPTRNYLVGQGCFKNGNIFKALVQTSGTFTLSDWEVIGIVSVNGYIGEVNLVTADISESGNLYFTNARVKTHGDTLYYPLLSNPAGYLTDISSIPAGGELSGAYPNPTIINSAVTGKLLTGLNVLGSEISDSDSILSAFGKIQNQINGVLGGAIYISTWDAATNTPSLTDGIGTKGHYYVSTSNSVVDFGNGNIDFNTGDWVIYNGLIWQKVDNTDAVSSVNGYLGAVNLVTSDITESGNLYFTNSRTISSTLTGYVTGVGVISPADSILQAIQKLNGNIGALVTGVSSVGANGLITSSEGATPQISTNMNTNKIVGRGSVGTGIMQEITLGTGLSLSGTTLNSLAPTVTIGDDVTTNSTVYLTWVANSTGNLPVKVSSTKLSFNPLTGKITTAGDAIINGLTIGLGLASIASNTAVGTSVLSSVTTGGFNTAVGYQTMFNNTTGINNTAVGYQVMFNNTTGSNNTVVGYQALFSNTTGNTNNTAVGYKSMFTNTTGYANNAYGYQSLLSNLTGQSNCAFGHNSLSANSTGHSNSAFGYESLLNNTVSNNSAFGNQALRANTTGTGNVAVGYVALTSNTTGADNTAIGYQSFQANTTGSRSVAVGYQALFNSTTADWNVAIGYQALFNLTLSPGNHNVAIGYNTLFSTTTGTNNVAMGYQTMFYNTTGNNNVAFGREALRGNLTGINNIAIGYTALRSSNTSDNIAIGHVALSAATTGLQNIAIGTSALVGLTAGINNVAIGYFSSASTTTGGNNTAIGNLSLRNNSTGFDNVAIGSSALFNNTTGFRNTALGRDNMIANTTGERNTSIGAYTLNANTTGTFNTAIGEQVLSSNTTATGNTAVGAQALQLNVTGGDSTAMGVNALRATTAGFNTGFGYRAGELLTTGTYNVFLGQNAGSGITTGNYNVVIGAQIVAQAAGLSNNIILSDGQGNIRLRFDNTGALILTGPAINVVSPTAPDRTLTINVGGTIYYLHAKTTND